MNRPSYDQPLNFYIVDVFAQKRYAGNQLAVFAGAAGLSSIQMQQIAREINFSETTFILGGSVVDGYDIRIFTPTAELPFAGHPTLGTAYVLQRQLVRTSIAALTLNLQAGKIPVRLEYAKSSAKPSSADCLNPERLWMRQNAPEFGACLAPQVVAPVCGLDVSDIDQRFPIQEISTGLPFILVPLRSLPTLQSINLNIELYWQLIKQTKAQAIFVFCPEAKDALRQFSARMFAPALGIMEDPATGSANGCLAAYLVHHRYFGTDRIEVQVEQGDMVGRPAVLYLRGQRQLDNAIEVDVGGQVILVAQGQFV